MQTAGTQGKSVDMAMWARGGSTPLRGALLGLLLERPGYGSELIHRLIGRVGETWRIEPKYVYRLLDQLEREGLVRSEQEPRRDNGRRMRVVYYPTELAGEAVTCWMQTLMPRAPVRLELQAKLAVARERDLPDLLVALRQYERECLALAQLVCPGQGRPRSYKALFTDCVRDSVHAILQAEIDWAARTRRRLREHAGGRA